MCHKWRSYDIWFLKDKAWQNIFCHFGPFLPFRTSDNPKLQKSNFEKLKKSTWRYYHFTHVHHKWQTFNLWLSGYGVCCHFGPFLALLCPNNPKKQNMEKFKKTQRNYHFIHTYQKWQSHDVWFLWYGTWRTDFSVILDHFLLFYNPKNQDFQKKKSAWRYYNFTQVHLCILLKTQS